MGAFGESRGRQKVLQKLRPPGGASALAGKGEKAG